MGGSELGDYLANFYHTSQSFMRSLSCMLRPDTLLTHGQAGFALGAPRSAHRGRWAMQQSPSPGDNDLANTVLSKLCPLLKAIPPPHPSFSSSAFSAAPIQINFRPMSRIILN